MNNKKIIRFLAIMFGSYAIFYLIYELWLNANTPIDSGLITIVGEGARIILKMFQYDTLFQNNVLVVDGFAAVSVGAPCNGFLLYVLHACFTIAVPGEAKNKIWYLLLGFLVIYLANAVRVALLALNVIYFPDSFDFNHHYLFTTLVYGLVFWLWVFWMNRFSDLKM